MTRNDNFTLRVNPDERQLIAAVAQRLDRNESDTLRLLVREKARALGVIETQKSGPVFTHSKKNTKAARILIRP